MSFAPNWNGLVPFHPISARVIERPGSDDGLIWCCQFCNRSFNSKKSFDQHDRDSQVHKIYCTDCHIRFSSKKTWEEHMHDFHQGPYICCAREFDTASRFSQHRKDSPKHAPRFICNRHGEFQDHDEHLDCYKRGCVVLEKCVQCGETTHSMADMTQHLLTTHFRTTQMFGRKTSRVVLGNPIRYGHYELPAFLYRVQHPKSLTLFEDGVGFRARSCDDPSRVKADFREVLSKHCNWQAFSSPFISMFSDRNHAINWARQRNIKGTFIKVISATILLKRGVRTWSANEIRKLLGLKVKNTNWHSDEWVCLHRIADWAIIHDLDF